MGTKQCTTTNVQVTHIKSFLVYLPTTHTLDCRNVSAFSGTQAIPDTVSVTKQVCQHNTFDVQPTWKLVLSPMCHSRFRCVSAMSWSRLSAKNTITWEKCKGSNLHVFIHPPLSLLFSRIYFHQSWQPQFLQIRGQKRKQDPNSHLDNHRILSSADSKNESVLSSSKSVSNWYGYFDLKKLNDVNSEKGIGLNVKQVCSLGKFISQVARLLDSLVYSKDNLSRSATLNNVLILGQLDKEM
jgi:hypothetical protein